MGKSLQDNRANQHSLHDELYMEGMAGFYLETEMKWVVEFNLRNQSANCLGVNPQFVCLNRTSWG
ncbi:MULTISPECIES: hypothetical protein [Planktothrix]|uniref:Uncharacterized protein n=1 Tax=Planktothrix pseudagardhii TaxID=132604 RepID=A0A9W4CRN1_9CYAN|nr:MULTISPECIES: hypothetical protein [Planktothrix]MBD2480517.1 hypothetical protein [Planktothrix sp. FACHB-1365]CAD5979186.1 hypothetical protein NO713_04490 [Planktothrix pseudagardhii]